MSLPALSGRLPAVLAVIALTTLWGCSRPPAPSPVRSAGHDHDHADDDHEHDDHEHEHADHDHPQSLAAGVAELRSIADRVKERLVADARDDADDAVHGMGHLLEDLHGLVRTSDLAAERKAAATEALDDLFECFDSLDTALHADPGTGQSPKEVHAAIAARVEAAIEALRTAAATTTVVVEDEAAAIVRDAQQKKKEDDR